MLISSPEINQFFCDFKFYEYMYFDWEAFEKVLTIYCPTNHICIAIKRRPKCVVNKLG